MTEPASNLILAIEDFYEVRRKAALRMLFARFTGESVRLLSFDEVRQKLNLQGGSERGLQDIPLNAIVGSVGRYLDFTRDFLPLRPNDRHRWARVEAAVMSNKGLPPIDVYKIGDVYFVKDGNHRVSVARRLGATHIQAYVNEIPTAIPLTPDLRPDDIILKAEYAGFLEKTHLNELRGGADLSVTVPGKHEELLEQIAYHHYDLSMDGDRSLSFEQAAADWYVTFYMPVVRIIRDQGILHFFPGRTETDLYLWISEHREELEKSLTLEVNPEAAASHLVSRFSSGARPKTARVKSTPIDKIGLDKPAAGSTPGEWDVERATQGRQDRLFNDILVPLNGKPDGWNGLEQALVVAQREGSRLYGLHVAPTRGIKGAETATIETRFNERCLLAGVAGTLVVGIGNVAQQISRRAAWVDLVVVNLSHPPEPRGLARLRSGFRNLVWSCHSPMLVTPQTVGPLRKALLAYDGSPGADGALFMAAYLAGGWQIPLVVVHIDSQDGSRPGALDRAREYLEKQTITAEYVTAGGPEADSIVSVSAAHGCDFLLLGGYGHRPFIEGIRGSTLDGVLRTYPNPVLICQ